MRPRFDFSGRWKWWSTASPNASGTNATVVTILCDSGLGYLSTDPYRET
jgi:hypothetical protein